MEFLVENALKKQNTIKIIAFEFKSIKKKDEYKFEHWLLKCPTGIDFKVYTQ